MEKKTFNLSVEVLKRFEEAGILPHIILIGSWSIYFYKEYFKSESYSTFIRTQDIDFLVPIPFRFTKELSIFKLIEDLGFLEEFRSEKGYIKLVHPDLTIEFLVPERGRGSDKPYSLKQLGINAVPLRYLDFLISNTIVVNYEGLTIRLPHPAAFVLHKFIIFKRRNKPDKQNKDIEGALRVYSALRENNELKIIKRIFDRMPKKWQLTIVDNLEGISEPEIIGVLRP